MRKNIITILVLIFLMFTASCNKDDGPTQSANDDIKHSITVEEVANGKISTSVVEAFSGDAVSVTVEPEFGYSLKSNSLKANDVLIENNSFVMPNEDVVITAQFVFDGNDYTGATSSLMVECEADKKTATATFLTKFANDGFAISAIVYDERISINDTYEHSR